MHWQAVIFIIIIVIIFIIINSFIIIIIILMVKAPKFPRKETGEEIFVQLMASSNQSEKVQLENAK